MSNYRLFAFYLPQYSPTAENDKWWGKGFTEWTNVGKAKPLFKGHYQPKVPTELGYYDLRLPQVREAQAELAKKAGIEGFCYWHYWFAGQRLLDSVFNEVINTKSPDFPFSLCWANHSWYAKTWKKDLKDKLLIEQTYPGVEDYIEHFNALLPAFKDKRYTKISGRLLFSVYAPLDIPNPSLFIDTWNRLAKENGLVGFYFVGFTFNRKLIPLILAKGFDAVTVDFVMELFQGRVRKFANLQWILKKFLIKFHRRTSYGNYVKYFLRSYQVSEDIHPCILPNFDHSPRSGRTGIILTNSTPAKWKSFLIAVLKQLNKRDKEKNIIFVKAWNEWGEGNYLEPDIRFGSDYISATNDALNETSSL